MLFHLTLYQWFSIGDDFIPQGNFAIIWRHFGCHNWGRCGVPRIQWVEGRNAAKHPTTHRTVPNKELSDPKYQQCHCIIS